MLLKNRGAEIKNKSKLDELSKEVEEIKKAIGE